MASGKRCEFLTCRAVVLPEEVYCRSCWSLVPSDVQRLVLKHLRPELERRLKRPAVLVRLLDEANKEILFVKTNGHRRPSDQAFMWDDDPAGSA